MLSVPLITETHTIGTLNLYSASAFDPTAEEAAASIANRAAAFSERADRHRQPSPPQQVQAKAATPSSPRRPRERSAVNVVDLAGMEDSQRLDRLRSLNLLDAAPRPNLDRLVRLACDLLETPIGLLEFDRHRPTALPGRLRATRTAGGSPTDHAALFHMPVPGDDWSAADRGRHPGPSRPGRPPRRHRDGCPGLRRHPHGRPRRDTRSEPVV